MTPPKGVTNPTQFETIVSGTFKYKDVDCSTVTTAQLTSMGSSVVISTKALACTDPLTPANCAVTSDATCTEDRRKLVRVRPSERRLATDSLEVAFNITVASYCQSGDCSGIQDIIDSVEAIVKAKIAGTTIVADLVTAYSSILASATAPQAITYSKVIVPMLEDFLNWYPDWHGGTNACRNDGEYPFYMSRQGSYFRSTLKDCCEYYYGWAYNECLDLSGGNAADLASNKFYADYGSESCVQDCPKDTSGKNCGGLVEGNWVVTYESASACCKGKFWWIDENVCIGGSTQDQAAIDAANNGSGKYYVDWYAVKCVKDCDKSTGDAECGGLAKTWDHPLFDSANACCSARLAFIDRDECTR